MAVKVWVGEHGWETTYTADNTHQTHTVKREWKEEGALDINPFIPK